MVQKVINIGAAPDDGTGTNRRTAFDWINQNIAELYGQTTFTNPATGGVARPVSDKARDSVNARDFGAVGDGSANDAPAIQAALNSGYDVELPRAAGSYRTTSGLTVPFSNQRLWGAGVLKPVGAFDAVSFASGTVGGRLSLMMDCTGHTGHCFKVSGASRVRIEYLLAINGYRLGYVENANAVTVDWVYAAGLRGNYGYRWFGNTALRSDVLDFGWSLISFAAGVYGDGLLMDGNVNSLATRYFGVVSPGYGIRILNTSGGPPPLITHMDGVQVDFPRDGGVRVDAGFGHHLISPYLHGSLFGSGIYVGAAVPADGVFIENGGSTGNARYGIETVNRQRMGGMDLNSNTLGQILGQTTFTAQRLEADPTAYLTVIPDPVNGDIALLALGPNTSIAFNRLTGAFVETVNGVGVLARSATSVEAFVPLKLKTYTVAGLPSAVGQANGIIAVSDGAGGQRIAVSDGTDWRFPDGSRANGRDGPFLQRQSTGATEVRLTTDGAAPAASNVLALANNSSAVLVMRVVARQTAGTAGTVGDSAIFEVRVPIKRAAGAASTVLFGSAVVDVIAKDTGAAAWVVGATADVTLGAPNIGCLGEANKTISWSATVATVRAA